MRFQTIHDAVDCGPGRLDREVWALHHPANNVQRSTLAGFPILEMKKQLRRVHRDLDEIREGNPQRGGHSDRVRHDHIAAELGFNPGE